MEASHLGVRLFPLLERVVDRSLVECLVHLVEAKPARRVIAFHVPLVSLKMAVDEVLDRRDLVLGAHAVPRLDFIERLGVAQPAREQALDERVRTARASDGHYCGRARPVSNKERRACNRTCCK